MHIINVQKSSKAGTSTYYKSNEGLMVLLEKRLQSVKSFKLEMACVSKYLKYYPAEEVDFFCEHHSMEAIAKDIENDYVSVLKIDGNIVTIQVVKRHIL